MNQTTNIAFRVKTVSAAISAAMALGVSAGAPAAGLPHGQTVSNGVNTYVVRFADLDLTKMEGAITLYARIGDAARRVCRTLDSRQLSIAAKYRTCLGEAVANAVASVDRPLLSQYHERRSKGDNRSAGQNGVIQLAKANGA